MNNNVAKQIKARKTELVAELEVYRQKFDETTKFLKDLIVDVSDKLTIQKGQRRSDDFKYNWLERSFIFKKSFQRIYAVYFDKFKSNELEPKQINKLLGFSGLNIHGNSVRFGFNTNATEDKVSLYAYYYKEEKLNSTKIVDIDFEETYFLLFDYDVEHKRVTLSVDTILMEPLAVAVVDCDLGLVAVETKLYYGGKLKAPEDITVYIKKFGANIVTVKEYQILMVLYYFLMIGLASIWIWFLIPMFAGLIWQVLKVAKFI